jgi:hypothetical protein
VQTLAASGEVNKRVKPEMEGHIQGNAWLEAYEFFIITM